MTEVWIGLGSNLGQPASEVSRAIEVLRRHTAFEHLVASSLYRSPPHGPQEQPDFINAVVRAETTLSPDQLLIELKAIEKTAGREPGLRWGPRILDMDILLYGDLQLHREGLTIPHKELRRREFVLYPMHEIDPDLHVPGAGALRELLQDCPRGRLERVTE